MRRGLVVAGLAGGFLLALAPAASAHPLGNFTVNTADRLLVGPTVQVLHVVDHAEIPTLQLVQSPDGPDADRDGTATPGEFTAWSAAECARLAPALSVVVDGSPAALRVASSAARSLPGQAGLAVSRLECTFDSGVAASSSVDFQDPTSAGRTGWKEVTATALCGGLTRTGGLPDTSPSALLTAYPADLLASPLDVTAASFGVTGSGQACRAEDSRVPEPSTVLPRGVDRLTTAYTDFVGRQDLTLPVALLAVLLSIALGCGHAVAPGHGKTVIAAYLVGQRGTRRQAVWLGATVTATHTAGVLLLGALLSLTSIAAPERFVPATEVASGLLLGGVGVFLLRRSVRARRAADHAHPHDGHGGPGGSAHDHGAPEHGPHEHGGNDHDHAGHDHGTHEHGHEDPHRPSHERELVPVGGDGRQLIGTASAPTQVPVVHSHGGRAHSHAPLEDAPLGWRTLATMGIAGGLVPSPSALVVLLGASALGRPLFGALLVVGYGLGMAITLTVAGLLLLRAQALLARRGWAGGRGSTALRVLPIATAVVVLAVGATIIVRGLLTFRGLG